MIYLTLTKNPIHINIFHSTYKVNKSWSITLPFESNILWLSSTKAAIETQQQYFNRL